MFTVYKLDAGIPSRTIDLKSEFRKHAIVKIFVLLIYTLENTLKHTRHFAKNLTCSLLFRQFRTIYLPPTELHQKWQNLSQNRIRRLTGSMRRIETVIRARGGYTRYKTRNVSVGHRCPRLCIVDRWTDGQGQI